MTRLGIRRLDLLLVAPLLLVAIAGSFGAARSQDARRPIDAAAIVLVVAGPLLLLVWRRFPLVTLVGVVGVTLVYFLADYPYGPVYFSLVLALIVGVVAGYRRLAWALAAGLVVVLFSVKAIAGIGEDVTLGEVLGVCAWLVVALSVAEVVKVRLERRAERAAAREDEMDRRAQEERLRIARELHDVLAHSISLINVQAGVGAARHGRAARAGAHVAHGHPRRQRAGPAGGPRDPGRPARHGRGRAPLARAHARRPRGAGRDGVGRRRAGGHRGDGRAAAPAARRGSGRVPHRPGGA